MPVEVKAPAIGESVSEIYIGQWRKAVGDRVEQDEPLVELESDKATLDLPAPASGVLTKILKQEGDAAETGEVIALIDQGARGAATTKPSAATETPRSEKAPPPEPPAHVKEASRDEPAVGADSTTAELDAEHARQGDRATRAPDDESRGHSPIEARAATPKAAQPAGQIDKPKSRAAAAPPILDASWESEHREQRVPMSPLRRQIAQRLVEAQSSAALLTTFNEVDLSAVKALRAEFGAQFEKQHGVRLGFMPFFVKAAVEALRACPELNSIVDGNDIVYRRYYDIGVAVSTEKGLVAPVLRDADVMSFADVERSLADLATRARDRTLRVEELQGGTFTITNGGVFGSLLSTPIVNPPQSGVLGMHAIQDRPVAHEGSVVIRPMMYLALTYDHRVVDGREAVTFLKRVKESVETPARLLLEV